MESVPTSQVDTSVHAMEVSSYYRLSLYTVGNVSLNSSLLCHVLSLVFTRGAQPHLQSFGFHITAAYGGVIGHVCGAM